MRPAPDPRRSGGPRGWRGTTTLLASALLAGCATAPPPPAAPAATPPVQARDDAPPPAPWAQAGGEVLGRNDRLLVYLPRAGDRLAAIASRFLGSADRAWTIAELNAVTEAEAGVPLTVPLQPLNPLGVTAERIQTVPILCYHRFGSGNSKMVVSPAQFEAQLEWLARNRYRVIRLAELAQFRAGGRQLPARSVVITIDDGYESVHRHAYPLLRRFGFPATLFVYPDFVGAGDAMSWAQLRELAATGLFDIQSHSKSHRNLVDRAPDESDEQYRRNVDAELRGSRSLLEARLPGTRVDQIAYPFGDANLLVVDAAARHGYQLGLTVVPGGNAFYAQPLLLRRTMIFGDLDLEGFRARLQTQRSLRAP